MQVAATLVAGFPKVIGIDSMEVGGQSGVFVVVCFQTIVAALIDDARPAHCYIPTFWNGVKDWQVKHPHVAARVHNIRALSSDDV